MRLPFQWHDTRFRLFARLLCMCAEWVTLFSIRVCCTQALLCHCSVFGDQNFIFLLFRSTHACLQCTSIYIHSPICIVHIFECIAIVHPPAHAHARACRTKTTTINCHSKWPIWIGFSLLLKHTCDIFEHTIIWSFVSQGKSICVHIHVLIMRSWLIQNEKDSCERVICTLRKLKFRSQFFPEWSDFTIVDRCVPNAVAIIV